MALLKLVLGMKQWQTMLTMHQELGRWEEIKPGGRQCRLVPLSGLGALNEH